MPLSLDDIVAQDLCTGCGLCASLSDGALTMDLDPEGFLVPRAVTGAPPLPDDFPRTLRQICPGLQGDAEANRQPSPGIWGQYQRACIGHATDPDCRFRASSGGALSALLGHLLSSGQVDAVLQIGASETDPLRNVAKVSSTVAEVVANAGSRYAPASPLEGLERILEFEVGLPSSDAPATSARSSDLLV